MRLISITAKNFRVLQDINLSFLSNYCTISGKNNTGKSCVIKLLLNLLQSESNRPWLEEDFIFDYKEDKTQWVKDQESIIIKYEIEISQRDDPTLISFLQKQSDQKIEEDKLSFFVTISISQDEDPVVEVEIKNKKLDTQSSNEIFKKLKNSNLLFHHNPTEHEDIFYSKGRRKALYEVLLSNTEQTQLNKAARMLESKIKKLAREHREKLNKLLGRLIEKYHVDFSVLQRYISRRHLFGITLNDKNVEVPLNDWGSGTQNRTYILASILHANKIKSSASLQDKITPIVVIEEPESFLHPSAQAEFGKILADLSYELGIQIIVTTHSPYLLNRKEPSSNILLNRILKRRKSPQTFIVNTYGDKWMSPFAEHLGIPSKEWKDLKSLFITSQKVLLVEGDVDKGYLEHLQKLNINGIEPLTNEIIIVAYGGYTVLKNTLLLKFVLNNYDKYFITFDKDASDEVESSLSGIGLRLHEDYIPIGLNEDGKDSIEGLLPLRILKIVHAQETNLVQKLGASDNSERKKAKNELKIKLLQEFKKHSDYTQEELKEFLKLVKIINRKFQN